MIEFLSFNYLFIFCEQGFSSVAIKEDSVFLRWLVMSFTSSKLSYYSESVIDK